MRTEDVLPPTYCSLMLIINIVAKSRTFEASLVTTSLGTGLVTCALPSVLKLSLTRSSSSDFFTSSHNDLMRRSAACKLTVVKLLFFFESARRSIAATALMAAQFLGFWESASFLMISIELDSVYCISVLLKVSLTRGMLPIFI